MNGIISIILLVVSVLIFYLYIDPVYSGDKSKNIIDRQDHQGIQNLKKVLEKIELKTDNVRQIDKKREELFDELTKINVKYGDKIAKIKKMITENVENVWLVNYIDSIKTRISGISGMTNIQIVENTEAKKKNKTDKNVIKITSKKDYKSIDLSFHVTTNYDGLKKFIDEIYHSLRIVDIVSINLQSPKINKNNQEFNDFTNDLYEVDIVVRTYWINKTEDY